MVSEKHDTLIHPFWGVDAKKNISDLDRSGSKVASKKKRSRGQWTTSVTRTLRFILNQKSEIIALWNTALSTKINSNFIMNHESKIDEIVSGNQCCDFGVQLAISLCNLVFHNGICFHGKIDKPSCKGQLPSTQSLPKAKKSRLGCWLKCWKIRGKSK